MPTRSVLRSSLLTLLAVAVAPACLASESDAEQAFDLQVRAKVIERTPPRYPTSELKQGRQGWVQLSYVVDTQGRTLDPVIEDSSGSSAFEHAAIRTVENWLYEPAMRNGEPVQQCKTKVFITFAIEGQEKRVSRSFYKRYRSIARSIDNGEFDAARELIDRTESNRNLSLSEMAWLWALTARIEGRLGNRAAQLAAIKKATRGSGQWLEETLYPNLLLVRTVLEMEQGNLADTLSTYERLVEMAPDLPQLDDLKPNIESIREIVASPSVLSVPARIGAEDDCVDCANNWHYDPLRRRFSIADVEGSLKNIEFRCAWQRVTDQAEEGLTWELPESYGECSIVVFGEPGTTFSLLEMPNQA